MGRVLAILGCGGPRTCKRSTSTDKASLPDALNRNRLQLSLNLAGVLSRTVPCRAVGWAEPVRRVMTSLQPPLLRQPDEMAAVAWDPGFLYLKSAHSGARCAPGGRTQDRRRVRGGD